MPGTIRRTGEKPQVVGPIADDESVEGRLRRVIAGRSSRVAVLALLLAPILVVAFASALAHRFGGGHQAARTIVDLAELYAPALAAALCARRALLDRRLGGLARSRSLRWWLFAACCGSWAGGQVAWSVYEVVLARAAPTPSPADVGYLGFAVLAPAAMAAMTGTRLRALRHGRAVLDGMVIVGALFLLSWLLVIHPLALTVSNLKTLLVSAAYPVGDVVVLSIALAAVARARPSRALSLMITGISLMALSDSAVVYLTVNGTWATGGPSDVGWTAAFVIMAAAALLDRGPRAAGSVEAPAEVWSADGSTGRTRLLLPYVPFVLGLVTTTVRALEGRSDGTSMVMIFVLVMLVLARQGLLVVQNNRLLQELGERSGALRVAAYTDPLTGIANRSAFTERLDTLLSSGETVTAAFCDLDSFKAVNDVCGHPTGDALLVTVARRLAGALRDGDLVARLGGDEFAVVATGAHPDELTARLRTALGRPYAGTEVIESALVTVAGRRSDLWEVVEAVTVSIGVVSSAEPGASGAEGLMHLADQRMYEVKRGRAAVRGARTARSLAGADGR